MRDGIDPQHADVVEGVPAHDLGGDAVAVLEPDEDPVGCLRPFLQALASSRDHVRARQDDSLRGDDEPGPLRLSPLRAGAEQRVDRDDAGRPRAVDPRRVESVAGERPGRGLVARRPVEREVGRVGGQEDRLRAVGIDDPRGRSDQEHDHGADDRRDERDDGYDPWAHTHSTVATTVLPFVVRIVVYSDNDAAGSQTWKTVRPGLDSRSISPSITSASSLAMARPRPLPDASVPSER